MAAERTPVVGMDLDNTLVLYDEAFHAAALDLGLVSPAVPRTKAAVRRTLRARGAEGEADWQRLQALVYARRPAEARPAPGAAAFLRRLAARGIPAFVVSHKTRRPAAGLPGDDLHAAARQALDSCGLLGPETGLAPERVFFEETRTGKVRRIAALGCTHFVDDLPAVFAHEDFPPGVERLLYAPANPAQPASGQAAFPSWDAVAAHILGR